MAEDIKENAMSGGTPARLRGLAANGNSISPTLEEVAKALPKRNEFNINIEVGEIYSLNVGSYNTLFVYYTSSRGVGCMVLLEWSSINIIGNNVFSSSDVPDKICIYNTGLGKYAIKNRLSSLITLKINVV
jgi:hypothetical protein